MSEFSESYHLQTSNRESAIELIKNSENKGYVFNEINGWVSFVIEYRGQNIEESLVEWNPGLLVHYTYLEDHGWGLSIYNKDDLVFDYKCDWTDDIVIEKNIFDLDLIQELVIKQGNSIDDLESLFDLKELNYDEPPAYILAQKLGLTYFEWISADNIEDQLSEKVIVIE